MDVILGRVDHTLYSKEPHLPLSLRPNVRGAAVGRSALFPGDDSLMAIADVRGGIIPAVWSAEQGSQSLFAWRDSNDLQRLQVSLEEVPS